MKFYVKTIITLCFFVCVRAQGQDCRTLLDSIQKDIELGRFSGIGPLLGRSESSCLCEGERSTLCALLLNYRGVERYMAGDKESAMEYVLKSRRMILETAGFFNDTTAVVYNNLVNLHILSADFEKARATLDTVFLIIARTEGESKSNFGTAMATLGIIHYYTGKLDSAQIALEKALENIERNLGGKLNYSYLDCLGNLLLVLSTQGKVRESIPQTLEGFEMSKKLLGEGHPLTITYQSNLGLAFFRLGDYLNAEKHFRKAVENAKQYQMPNANTIKIRYCIEMYADEV